MNTEEQSQEQKGSYQSIETHYIPNPRLAHDSISSRINPYILTHWFNTILGDTTCWSKAVVLRPCRSTKGDSQPTMANRRKKPLIPFDYEPDHTTPVVYIKHQLRTRNEDNGYIVEDNIPKLNEDASPYEILQFLSTFQRVRKAMGCTTGSKLYQKFPIHLHDYHLDVWELVSGDRTHTVAHFNAQLQGFKLELLRGYRYEEQMNYLRSLKKPGKMEPSQFLLKLRSANRMAIQLPDALEFDQGFSDLQLRRVFLAAMPSSWQDHLEDANLDVDNTTIEETRNYMDKQSNKDPFNPKNKDKGNNNCVESNARNKKNRGGNRTNNPKWTTNNPQGQGNRTATRNSNRIQNSDLCLLPGHGKHAWGQCRSNRFNKEGRPKQPRRTTTPLWYPLTRLQQSGPNS